MTARSPVPLRPDYTALEREATRSIIRAITAQALSAARRTSAANILSKAWPNDDMAEIALRTISTRAASSPLKTTDAPALAVQGVKMLARLAPKSAALRLFAGAMSIDMTGGIASIRIPNVADVPPAKFIAEGEPAPMVRFTLSGAVLGPVKKIVVLSAVTRELETANPESASEIISRLLASSAEKGIDAVAFGTAPADDAQPAGLLNGITPVPPTAGGGMAAMTADVANLAGAIADAGLDASNLIIVASPKQAVTLALLAGPRFTFPIYSTIALPAGSVAAFAPDAIAAAFEGAPEIETSTGVAHYESVTPGPIADDSGVLAAPTLSAFQQDLIALKCAARLAWVLAAPGGAQIVNGATW